MLTILKESNDVFMACRDDNRFCTTGILRYAIMPASMSSNTRRTQRPADINSKLHHDKYVNQNPKYTRYYLSLDYKLMQLTIYTLSDLKILKILSKLHQRVKFERIFICIEWCKPLITLAWCITGLKTKT